MKSSLTRTALFLILLFVVHVHLRAQPINTPRTGALSNRILTR